MGYRFAQLAYRNTVPYMNPAAMPEVPSDTPDWDGGTTYNTGDYTVLNGVGYKSLIDNNSGLSPDVSPSEWQATPSFTSIYHRNGQHYTFVNQIDLLCTSAGTDTFVVGFANKMYSPLPMEFRRVTKTSQVGDVITLYKQGGSGIQLGSDDRNIDNPSDLIVFNSTDNGTYTLTVYGATEDK
jgi:hypothetical protein